ncbi:Cysteine--tRNA ligase [Gracilaria domingensis]|nr:Cysteine--tRNA ligase [Gracilaria domingensis]
MSRGQKAVRTIVRTILGNRPIVVRNSLLQNGEKEALSSMTLNEFKWYTCGPTVYDDAHLGHARSYVSFDIIRRILTNFAGLRVIYAMGVTDIDDKILNRAKERDQCPRMLARHFETRFFEDMHTLNILPPTRILRVTEHIGELQHFIMDLVNSKSAYETKTGNVYFSVESSGDRYGQLDPSRMISDENDNNMQDPTKEEKKDWRDFALWKASENTDGDKSWWESGWGPGRPGWHVECSAMAMATMGDHLDLHTGGIDLRFPHHTNELATAECRLHSKVGDMCKATRWSNTWLHGGHLHLKGRKMSKSVKNFVTVRDFLKDGGSADGFRTFCLLHRYSSPVEYSEDRLADAEAYSKRVQSFLAREVLPNAIRHNNVDDRKGEMHPACKDALRLEEALRGAEDAVDEALADDFDTPRVMGALSSLIKAANTSLNDDDSAKSGAVGVVYDMSQRYVQRVLNDLGLTVGNRGAQQGIDEDNLTVEEVIDMLLHFRSNVRDGAREKDMQKLFEACDRVRDEAQRKLRIRIMDGKQGRGWSRR